MRVSPGPTIVSGRLAMTHTGTGPPPGRRIDGIDPEGAERCVHRTPERRHQVRLPLISTAPRADWRRVRLHVQHDPARELLVHRLLGVARKTDGVRGRDEVGRRVVLPEQTRHPDREEVRLRSIGEVHGADPATVLLEQDAGVLERAARLRYKKPIIPLLFDPDVEMPFLLEPRQYLTSRQTTSRRWRGCATTPAGRSSPEGLLQGLKERLFDAERDLPQAKDAHRPGARRPGRPASLSAALPHGRTVLTADRS